MDRDDVATDAILRLLSQGGPEVQCAASIVLGALQPADPRVVPALACALHDAENPVKPYLLETLVSLSGPDVYRHVEPILRVEGPLRGQAADALTRHGARFLDDLKASCSRAAAGERDTYIRIIARIPDLGAIDWALESLPGLAMEDARTLVRSIRFALPGMPATLKRRLATGLVSFLRATPPGAAQVAETAVMKLLAVCGDGRAVTPLLQRVDQTEDPELGRHVLHALASTPIPRNRHGTILRKLMPRLEEGEAPHLAEHGMRVITSLRPFPLDAPSVMSLTRSPNPRIAHMAVRSLRHFSGSDVVDRLLACSRARHRSSRPPQQRPWERCATPPTPCYRPTRSRAMNPGETPC